MKIRIRGNGNEGGMAMILATVGVFAAAGLVGMLMTISIATDTSTQNEVDRRRAQYLAEGAVEAAKKAVQEAVANWSTVPSEGYVEIDGIDVNYTITPTGYDETVTDSSGIQTYVTGYEIQSVATAGAFEGAYGGGYEKSAEGAQAVSHRIVNTEATPIFQFAVFYDSDLEILPGPVMTLGGRVHCNEDMYMGSNTTLYANTNYLRCVGDVFRCRKDNPAASQGIVNIRKWVANPFDTSLVPQYVAMNSKPQMTSLGVATDSGYDSAFTDGFDLNADGDFMDVGDWLPFDAGALEMWSEPSGYTGGSGSTLMTGAHGVTEAVAPKIGSINMFEPAEAGAVGADWDYNAATGKYSYAGPGMGQYQKGYYHDEAGLSVISHPDGTWNAFDGSGVDVTAALAAAGVVTQKSIYDARQALGQSTTKYVKLCQIDMAKLNTSGLFPANGLLYAGVEGTSTGIQAHGVRLTNGSELAAKLTVVSENPVYIKGDYNTVSKKGAAVICDAINLLSNAWNDTKTKGTLPTASNTTYNLAVIAGNTETVVGSYNGGLENLPRFHEKWSGKTCTISGSFVNAWYSQHATSPWAGGATDVYAPPSRNWNYDTSFNTVSNLPPFTPMVVSADDVVSW